MSDIAAKTAVPAAAPFWVSLLLPPVVIAAAWFGGWALLLPALCTWYLFAGLDLFLGRELRNADPETQEDALRWHRALTMIWVPVQFALIFGLIWFVPRNPALSAAEQIAVFVGLGIVTGTIGINYAHEMMHQKSKVERWGADLLLATVLYAHFRTEHLLVHHRHVATPRDPATARFGESFYRFFPRVVWQSLLSAFRAEAAQLARAGLDKGCARNAFWRYGALQLAAIAAAFALSGVWGCLLLVIQAGMAIMHLELVNYIEHYGLQRRQLDKDRFEPVGPHHSWNAANRASNWLLINLQRHSDHHYKPQRRFALLQNHAAETAPQLPFGYAVMGAIALTPPLWRRVMHPRVLAWRARFQSDPTAP